jgi:hypothetical protein
MPFRSLLVKIQKQTENVHPSMPVIQPPNSAPVGYSGSIAEVAHINLGTQPQVQYAYMELPAKLPFTTDSREKHLPKRLSAYLSARLEPAGYRMKRWLTAYHPQWSVDLRFGPTVTRSWTQEGRATYKTVCWKRGLCFNLTFRLHKTFPRRFTLVVASVVNVPSIDVSCNLAMHCILDTRSNPYMACLKGDWNLLRELIEKNKVGISDTTAYGSTLLHVSSYTT